MERSVIRDSRKQARPGFRCAPSGLQTLRGMGKCSHIMIGTNDLDKAKAFYDQLLGTLEVRPARVDGHRIFYITKTGVFSVTKPINGEAATCANGSTIGFAANSPEQVDKWHATGVAAGGTPIENPPASARAQGTSSTSLICATSTATRSARCIGCRTDCSRTVSFPALCAIAHWSGESSTPRLLRKSLTSRSTGSPGQAGR